MSSCIKDPWKQVEEGSWNNDHRILEIKFAGQAGKAVVKDTDKSSGTITVQLATILVTDMSKVVIETLDLSYKATANVKRGETIDFTAGNPVIKVTSETGLSREYTVYMTEFSETITGKYAITGSMAYVGTGPTYGGCMLIAPEKQTWCWYMDEGFGPNAEYDDYLEFTLDEILPDGNTTGKCIHYGGVDGKHWNCLMVAKQNKRGTTDVDLHKFFRQIPIHTSTWLRNYTDDTITFTDEKGTQTVGRLLEKGSYNIYHDDTRDYTLTVEKQAFAFKLSGVDDWDSSIIYTDYGRFAVSPRYYFVLVESVDSIPAESAKEGTEGKNTVDPNPEPENPDPNTDPDPDPGQTTDTFDLSGSWEVSTLIVYGGSVNNYTKDPAEIKTWDWNNCNKELDNIITFTPDSDGALSGKLLYSEGEDKEYWDYLYVGKKAGVAVDPPIDCTEWYGWLPHTETTYTYNPDDTEKNPGGTISIKDGDKNYYSYVLVPGSYEFLGLSAIEIPKGSMALARQLLDTPSTDDTYKWTDYDKFVNSPLLYVMVFEKKQ